MNTDIFIDCINSLHSLDNESLPLLENLLVEFPYCQTTHLLYTKNLHNQKHIRYNTQLKVAATYAADRKTLYRLIMQPVVSEIIEQIEKETAEFISPSELADKPAKKDGISPLEQEILRAAVSASIAREAGVYYAEKEPSSVEKEELSKTKISQKDKYTFSNWMKVLGSESVKAKPSKPPIDELVEKFLKEEPKISSKAEFFSPSNVAKMSIVDDESFVTETLAKIYEQQGNYEKAIRAYQQLALKYPKKKNTFAARILQLEKKLK
ncbi:MAG: hypothetical protein COA57_02650 [Flavobacteriales bacterium]|nr:MAG: hypothetical protein COA57_02650 [Flavobacteriales bacterium]